jgi:nitroreductase
MNLYETIRSRRSVRNYKSTPIKPETLGRIWEAVRWAPSACNLQPWRFLIVKANEGRDALRPIFHQWVFTAPLIVVALGNRQTAWQRDGESVHAIDVAIAFEHLVLAAAAEGLGTCWICAFNRRALSYALNLDPEWDPVAVTPIGYPNDPSPPTTRKELAEILTEI